MVTHQLQVRCRPVKVRRSETDVLPLSHPTNLGIGLATDSSQVQVPPVAPLHVQTLGSLFTHTCHCSPSSINRYRRKLGAKQTLHATLAPCPWTCSIGWCLAEDFRNGDQRCPMGACGSGKTSALVYFGTVSVLSTMHVESVADHSKLSNSDGIKQQ